MNGIPSSFTSATGLAVLCRHLVTWLAYELRDRNKSPEGKPASVTYLYTRDERKSA